MSDSPAPSRVQGMDHVDVWIFDLDNTLYPASCNLFEQVRVRIGGFIAERFALDIEEARELQRRYFLKYGTTLRGLMTVDGVSPDEFLEYVHDIDVTPVPPSPELDATLDALDGRKLIFTNGSAAHGIEPERALMVEDMAVNLVPAHALGMTTVWVRTEHEWTGPKPGETHVDREIDDLAGWLKSVVAARGASG